MRFKLSQLVLSVGLVGVGVNAMAIDSYDLNSNTLTMPSVLVSGTNYAVTLKNTGNYIFQLIEAKVTNETTTEPYDEFHTELGLLTIPQVTVGNDIYSVSMTLLDAATYTFQLASADIITEPDVPATTTPTTTPEPTSTTSNSTSSLPSGLTLRSITGGTFTMGNNDLKGPQSGQASEHQVTLSDYQIGETEVSNAQFLGFLNAALKDGLITVTTGTNGPDAGAALIVGTASSNYADKVLYNMSGTRVMKDHDDQDGDGDPFTGVIEPENPLNIAYIAYDQANNTFYIKDPRNPNDFNWIDLTNYYNWSTISHTSDTSILLNDFDQWDELKGWSESTPELATALPPHASIQQYPATFVRWWGAYAFADYYGLKLPTEAQWEYAAKGGSNFTYAVYDGVTTSDANWNSQLLHPATHHVREVKSGSPNPYGLYNLGGNVWEWIADNYQAYDTAAVADPLITVDGSTSRAWRGGSWNYHEATLESSARYSDDENKGNDHFGFRVVDHN